MPRRFPLGDLVTMCKQQVDAENQDSISTAEWKRMLGTIYGELYATVANSGMRYFEADVDLASDGTNVLGEPPSHLATVGLDYLVTGSGDGERRELVEIMAQERNRFAGLAGEARAFAFVDDEIRLYPTPPSGHVFNLVYIPQPPKFTTFDDEDEVDVVGPDGEAFLIWGVAVLALGKEDSDTNLARAERDAAKGRLAEWAAMRAFNNPRRAVVGNDPGYYADPADYWGRGGGW